MLRAAWEGLWQERPDVVLAVSPLPTGLAAMLVHWARRAPLVFDLQDIWPDSALAVGVLRRAVAAFHMEAIRFRMYSVDRLLHRDDSQPQARQLFEQLRHELEAAGFHTRSHTAP